MLCFLSFIDNYKNEEKEGQLSSLSKIDAKTPMSRMPEMRCLEIQPKSAVSSTREQKLMK